MKHDYHFAILGMLSVIIVLQLVLVFRSHTPRFTFKTKSQNDSKKAGTCSKDSCGSAIDDVNNPAYNMQNVVKQSILLEEHIAEKNKYCISCIVKHFLHIIGLSEEAVWMAGPKLADYPHLDTSVNFYETLFNLWNNNKDDEKIKKDVLLALRERRRELINVYLLKV